MSLSNHINALYLSSALMLSACDERPDKILIDYKCSKGEADLIAKTIREWYIATDSVDVYIPYSLNFNSDEDSIGFLDAERDGEAEIYKIDTNHPGYPELVKEAGTDMLGYGVEGTQIVFVEDNIQGYVDNGVFHTYEDAFYYTALHEFGHFIGLGHLNSPRSIMANQIYAGTGLCIDEKTLDYYCKNNYCGYFSHPTCEDDY